MGSDWLLFLGMALGLVGLVVVAPGSLGIFARWVRSTFRRKPTPGALMITGVGGDVPPLVEPLPVRPADRQAVADQIEWLATAVERLGRTVLGQTGTIQELTARTGSDQNKLARLRSDIEAAEMRSSRLDARGVLPVWVSTVLTGLSDKLSSPWWVFVIAALAGLATLALSVRWLRQDYRAERSAATTP